MQSNLVINMNLKAICHDQLPGAYRWCKVVNYLWLNIYDSYLVLLRNLKKFKSFIYLQKGCFEFFLADTTNKQLAGISSLNIIISLLCNCKIISAIPSGKILCKIIFNCVCPLHSGASTLPEDLVLPDKGETTGIIFVKLILFDTVGMTTHALVEPWRWKFSKQQNTYCPSTLAQSTSVDNSTFSWIVVNKLWSWWQNLSCL